MRVIWEQADLPEAEIIVRGRLDDKKTAELLVTLQSLAGADKETGHRIFLYRDGREFSLFLFCVRRFPHFSPHFCINYDGE